MYVRARKCVCVLVRAFVRVCVWCVSDSSLTQLHSKAYSLCRMVPGGEFSEGEMSSGESAVLQLSI